MEDECLGSGTVKELIESYASQYSPKQKGSTYPDSYEDVQAFEKVLPFSRD